jgi:hypothetical protein
MIKTGDPELDGLIARWRALSPTSEMTDEERREQKISWAYGQCRLSGTDISRQRVREILEDLESEGDL